MMNNSRRFYAFALAVLAVANLAACTQMERTTTSQAPDASREVRGGFEEQQPVAGQPTGREFFQTLKPGQDVNYYTREFQRMGYDVVDVNRSGDQAVYDLRKDNERHVVDMTLDQDTNRVSKIDTREYRRAATGEGQKDAKLNQLAQQVEKLQPGKKPVEYLPQLSKWGEVQKFDAGDERATAEIETPDNKQFQVEMSVDPQRKVVTDITVDKDTFWSI